MAKAKRARNKSSKRGRASAKPARKKTGKRATPKRAKSKVRRADMSATKLATKKKPPKIMEDELHAIDDRPSKKQPKTLDEYPDMHTDLDQPSRRMDEIAAAVAAATHWQVAKSLRKLLEQVNSKFPGRRKGSDGTIGDERHCGSGGGSSDHCPNVLDGSVGVVTAMDITHDPAHGLDAGTVANKLRLSHDPRIKYIISNRRIANFQSLGGRPPFAWRPYGGGNPHEKHFHISVKSGKTGPGGYDTIADWNF